jgi:hypothetical protein
MSVLAMKRLLTLVAPSERSQLYLSAKRTHRLIGNCFRSRSDILQFNILTQAERGVSTERIAKTKVERLRVGLMRENILN